MTDFNCTSCSNANGTWQLDWLGGDVWQASSTFSDNCSGTIRNYKWTIYYEPSGPYGPGWLLVPTQALTNPAGNALAVYQPVGQFDCNGCNTFSLVSYLSACQGWPQNITLLPNGSSCGSSSSAGSGSNTSGCSVCPGGAPVTWTVTFSGVTNGTCTQCGNFNRTWSLIYGGGCSWTNPDFPNPCNAMTGISLSYNSFTNIWSLSTFDSVYQLSGASFNCLSSNTLTRVGSTGGGCNNWPATVTINPA